jgi:hypothetical protein
MIRKKGFIALTPGAPFLDDRPCHLVVKVETFFLVTDAAAK